GAKCASRNCWKRLRGITSMLSRAWCRQFGDWWESISCGWIFRKLWIRRQKSHCRRQCSSNSQKPISKFMNAISDLVTNQVVNNAADPLVDEAMPPAPTTELKIQIGPDCPRVTERVAPNQAETSLETGQIRLRWLTPFAQARRG